MARYSIRHDPLAPDELREAADWHGSQADGLDARFIEVVKAKLEQIRENPRRWALERDGTRHALLPPFKYMIVFRLMGDVVQVIAYAHTSRRPGYWRRRLRDK